MTAPLDSIDLANLAILIGAALVLVGIFSSLVARKFGAPLLLVFLVLGMLAGEDGPGGLQFNDYQATYLIGSLALSIILFDGGLRTKLAVFRGVLAPSLLLATVGVLITAAITGGVAILLLPGLDPLEALLMGAIVASTDAAAVFFLLRAGGLRLQQRVGAVLEIESGTNDPVAIFLTVVLAEIVVAGSSGGDIGWALLTRLLQQGALGAMLGLAGGFAIVTVLNRMEMPGGLHPLLVVATAVLLSALVTLAGGSGLLAVYIAGLVVANRPVRAYPTIVGFHDAATWLCQIVMFLVLGLLVTPSRLVEYAVPGIALALALTFVARPVAVWLCLWPFGFAAKETGFVSWVGLRGAVSIFLAAIPTLGGVPHAHAFFNIAFFVVLISLLVQGWTITALARRLGFALRRTAPAVTRVDVDLPGQTEQELVGYPVTADSMVLGLSRLPSWTRLVLVVREREILAGDRIDGLRAGDYAYFLTPMQRVPRLDWLFADTADLARRSAHRVGELAINADARLGDIADLYDLAVADPAREITVADYFASHLRAPAQPGHRLPLGRATLVVRAAEDGRVARAGLLLDELLEGLLAEMQESRPLLPSIRPRAWLSRLQRWLRRRR